MRLMSSFNVRDVWFQGCGRTSLLVLGAQVNESTINFPFKTWNLYEDDSSEDLVIKRIKYCLFLELRLKKKKSNSWNAR